MSRSLKLRAGIVSFAVLFFAVLFTFFCKATNANAENIKVVVQEINYERSYITIKANPGDTKIYFSDKAGKKWDTMVGTIGDDRTISMDISWIPVSSNYTIKFKGDHSQEVVTVVIPKQYTKFKAKYNRVKEEVTYTNGLEANVEWRKKDTYIWKSADSSLATELKQLSAQGATVYLRLKPVNGGTTSGVFTAGQRASKEVTIAIPKKADAPAITVDGSKFLIPVKKNSSYRVVYENGTKGDWNVVNTASDLLLSNIASDALYVKNEAQKEVTLQFIMNATSSTPASRISTVTIPVQAAPPSIDTYGISLEYTSATTLDLVVKSASTIQPFEYAIVHPEDTFDYQQLTWTSITSSAKVTIKEEKAKEGSHIYVRKKSIAKTDKVAFALASKELDITGSTGVKYPSVASGGALTTLITTAGTVNEEDSSSYLTFTINSPTKTTASSIKFKDIYGDTKGTVTTLKSTVAKNTHPSADGSDNYIITIKITSTASIDSVTEEALFATIVMANGDEVVSSESTGIKLFLYPKTVVNNKDDKLYTNNFERVICSNDEKNDPKSFKFNLDFGKMYVYDQNGIKEPKEEVRITKMTYDGYELTSGDYSVAYDNTKLNNEHEPMLKALVTVNVSNFETNQKITKRNTAVPLIIYLSNGEKLENAVTIKLVETATIQDAPVAYSITEGSLEETKTEIVTNEDKTTTSVTKEVITFSLKLNIFKSTYDVGISDVTWDGKSIMKSAEISGGVATVYLSNPKINKLTTTDSTKTANIVVTLSNGYVIDKGCKLTIIKKN